MKKRLAAVIQYSLIVLFLGATVWSFNKNLNEKKLIERRLEESLIREKESNDSLQMAKYVVNYLGGQFTLSFVENNKVYDVSQIDLFRLKDGQAETAGRIGDLFEGKNKLFVRYTEIGCNSCSDSTIKAINQTKSLKDRFQVVYLVDFSNSDAYLKWRKVTGITDPVYWVKRGALPFAMEQSNESYVFTVSAHSKVGNFFIPSSRLPYFIHNYLQGIAKA